MSYDPWAKPIYPRRQQYLISPTLDDLLEPDDQMRLFDELLDEVDWAPWEAKYDLRRGQPPIHPRLVAGLILYGLIHAVRSSRKLERASRRWLDLIWFLEGRTIDHTTICNFREKFNDLLAALFDHLSRCASACAGEKAGRRAAVDGTRVRANSARQGARTAKKLRERLEEVAKNSEQLLEELARRDALEAMEEALGDTAADTDQLRRRLEHYDAQREKLERALVVAEQRDAIKQAKEGAGATAVRVPVTDPQAHVMPHKEGGYGPNWTPTVAVDVDSGAILDARVVDGAEETAALMPAVEAAERIHGRRPEAILADGNFASGAALEQLDEAGVEMLSPSPPPIDPAVEREDLSQPVAEELHERLPRQGKGEKARLSQRAFVYEAEQDVFYCPQGRVLRNVGRKPRRDKNGRQVERWRYTCADCSGCPLARRCLSDGAAVRSVLRDQYQPQFEQLARRIMYESSLLSMPRFAIPGLNGSD